MEHWLIFALDINKQMSRGRREKGVLLSLPLARANTLSLMNAYTDEMFVFMCVCVGRSGRGEEPPRLLINVNEFWGQ